MTFPRMLIGLILLLAILAAAWSKPGSTPTPDQRQEAIAAGWVEGTDGYYRAIYGDDAY